VSDWMRRVRAEEAFVARELLLLEEQSVEQAVRGVCEAVATAWARCRPLPRTPEELPLGLIAARYCHGEGGLVRWVAGVLLRRGVLPLVGDLEAPDVDVLEKWKAMFDWGAPINLPST